MKASSVMIRSMMVVIILVMLPSCRLLFGPSTATVERWGYEWWLPDNGKYETAFKSISSEGRWKLLVKKTGCFRDRIGVIDFLTNEWKTLYTT